jgi:opacity protein-like surface antigen
MFNRYLGVGGGVAFASWHASDELAAEVEALFGPGVEAVFNNWSYSAFGILAAPMGRLTPYARGGGGLFNPKWQLKGPPGQADQTTQEWGVTAAGGVALQITEQVSFGFEGSWSEYFDHEIDEKQSWIDARAQFLFRLPDWDKMGL